MANTFTAAFAQTTQNNTAVTTTAGTYVDDSPTNTQLLVTAGADGALVTKITAVPRATVTATACNLFFSPDDGTTNRLIDNVLMAAHTVAATTAIPVTPFSLVSETTPIRLQAGEKLYVNSAVTLAGGIVYNAEWTDF